MSLFQKFGYLTLIMVYSVILAGSIVRATGAGMGCPDWPKCFGQWIPPTDISELPSDYQLKYKVANKEIEPFNAIKTWTEYINRLVGATSGLFLFVMLLTSIKLRKSNRNAFISTGVAFVLIAFQGWLGAKVVDSFLAPYMITIHMLLAFIIIFVLIYAIYEGSAEELKLEEKDTKILQICFYTLIALLIQVILGTQVRENIDEIAFEYSFGNREIWINELDLLFYFHRSFSIVLISLVIYLYVLLNQSTLEIKRIKGLGLFLVAIVALEGITGLIMNYFAIPAFTQTIHLFNASLMAGIIFYILLTFYGTRKSKIESNIV